MTADDIKIVTVLGAGAMGNGIAQVAMMAGYKVYMRDIEQKFVDNGMKSIKFSMDKLLGKGKLTQEHYDDCFSRLTPIVDLKEAVKDADLIVEAAPEIMDLKKKIFAEVDSLSKDTAILATNTSTMSVSQIASATKKPENVVGMHFFNPAVLLKLVEVIRGDKSSNDAVQATFAVAKKMNKIPVIVEKDSPGFIYNRVNAPTGLLLQRILEQGTPSPEQFDAVFKAFMPMAPFELMDYVGIDIAYNTQKYFSETISKDYTPTSSLQAKVDSGDLGKKTGKGFYDWSAGRPQIDTSNPTTDFDMNHMIALQVNEATKLLEEGVSKDPAEIDSAIANGGGGIGPFTLAKNIGYDVLTQKCDELADRFGLEVFRPTKTMKEGNINI